MLLNYQTCLYLLNLFKMRIQAGIYQKGALHWQKESPQNKLSICLKDTT